MSSKKREMFVSKDVDEKALITEFISVEPHYFKQGAKKRDAAWTAIPERLNEMKMVFKVNQKSVREKFEKMMKEYEKKEKEEKGASGVSVQYSDIHRSLEDIKGRIAELNEAQQIESQRKEKERASAEDMRKMAVEKYSSTKKRHSEITDDDEEVASPATKRKSRQNNMCDVLAGSVQIKRKESELRQQELELRAEEQKQQRLFQEHLLTQKQQVQQVRQAMNLAMLNVHGELLQKMKN